MKRIVWFSLVLVLLWSPVLAADEVDKGQAQAAAYFEALMTADVAKSNSLIDIPYSFDGRETFKTVAEVQAAHQKIADSKGKRPVPKYTIAKTNAAPKLDAAIFAKHEVFLVTIGDEHVAIYVSLGQSPKVIGFND